MPSETTPLSSTWSPTGKFSWGEPYITSLRGKDPKRTATTSMHVPINLDANGRCPGVKSHHFGPGQKVIGGQLTYTHEDLKDRRVRLERSLDPAEILRLSTMKLNQSMKTTRPATVGSFNSPRAHVPERPSTSLGTTSTAVPAGSSSLFKGSHSNPAKAVFWDGRQHHILDKPSLGLEGGPAAEAPSGAEWKPPHLEHRHIQPGHFVGVTERTGTIGNVLIGGKARLLLPNTKDMNTTYGSTNIDRRPGISGPIPPPYGAIKGPYGLVPYAPINQTTSYGLRGNIDEGTLRSYATEKLMGYREYENTCKNMEGMQAWRASQCYLTTSMAIGQVTRMMPPKEHMATKLSLRR